MKVPLGRVTAFDHNPRNRSAEFGYYLPPMHRQQGYGRAMVQRFLTRCLPIACGHCTSCTRRRPPGTSPSIRLLEGLGFHLDGVMREHYWFPTEVQGQRCYSLLAREWKLR